MVPCQPVSKVPIFNKGKDGELWVILLEKAWAKINGGYDNISAGLTREALRGLTGASAKTFFTKEDREKLWRELLASDKQDFIMTACSDELDNNKSDAYIEKIGICGSHAYSLISAFELEYVGGRYVLKTGG